MYVPEKDIGGFAAVPVTLTVSPLFPVTTILMLFSLMEPSIVPVDEHVVAPMPTLLDARVVPFWTINMSSVGLVPEMLELLRAKCQFPDSWAFVGVVIPPHPIKRAAPNGIAMSLLILICIRFLEIVSENVPERLQAILRFYRV